jgi:hypothetical protein
MILSSNNGERSKPMGLKILSSFFSVLLTILCLSPSATAEILFQDDFNDGTADGWKEYMGTWGVINGQYVSTGVDNKTLAQGFNGSTYIIEARIKMDVLDNDFGLIFHAQSENDYLRFTMDEEFGSSDPRISRMVNDESIAELAIVLEHPTLLNDQWYDFRLVVTGDRIFAYINDDLIAYAYSLPHDQGGIGLVSDSAIESAHFDNIVITSQVDPNILTGTWGYAGIEREQAGESMLWGATIGKKTFNVNGTGIDIYQAEWSTGQEAESFFYSLLQNPNGSLNLAITLYEEDVGEWETGDGEIVISDNHNMIIGEGFADCPDCDQDISPMIRMDTSRTYSNASLSGDAYGIGYGYDRSLSFWPGQYTAWSGIKTFDGNGNCPHIVTFNSGGNILDGAGQDIYSLSPDGFFSMTNGRYIGYIGEGPLAVLATPTMSVAREYFIGMIRGDRVYSTSDLAGMWAIQGIGDENGTSFDVEFGSMSCDTSGKCSYHLKEQRGLDYQFNSDALQLTVASDGSFGGSLGSNFPSYAGALGNDGNTIIFNLSFNQDQPDKRSTFIGIKCSNCKDLTEMSGDTNLDGLLDISDVILILRIALQLDSEAACSDINNDGQVDISDVILTLRMALGLDPPKPCI